MRGSPILRIILLAVAMGLAGVLVAAVLGSNASPQPEGTAPAASPTSSGVPCFITVRLSSPAKSLLLTEPSGRVIEIPTDGQLELEHEAELTITESSWSALLSVQWATPAPHHFLGLEFEPDGLATTKHLVDCEGDVNERAVEIDFSTTTQSE